MSKIKGLIFDNDGVLVHTEHVFFEVNKQVFDSLHINYDKSDFVEHTFDTGLGSSGWMRKKGYDESTIINFSQKRDALYAEKIRGVDVSEPVAKLILADLKRDYILCIATNTKRNTFQLTHGWNEITTLFDEVVCREDYAHTKPAPDAYLAALRKTKLEADEVVVIEDSPRGIEAAQRAGMRVVAISNPHFPNLHTEQAEYHISSLTELPDLLRQL